MTVVVTHSTPADGTFSATGATAWDSNHTLVGVGTMAEQNANAVAITGGTITGATLPTTSLTGAITSAQIAATGVAAATYGTANTFPIVTVNAAGQITSASTGTIPNNYRGTWNASTNSPTIVSSVGTAGFYYIVAVAGTTTINGISSWAVGDWIVYNGSVWQQIVGASTGTVTISDVGYAANQIPLNQYLGRLAYQDALSAGDDGSQVFVGVSDVGIQANQVPLNQYLGRMAWQDPAGVKITGGTVAAQLINTAPTPTALTGSATLTTAQIQTKIITVNSTTAVALTMPTGTVIDGAIVPIIDFDTAIDFWIINIGSASGAVTVSGATGSTLVGSGAVAISTSAFFRLRRTALNTYSLYRLA